MTDFDSMVVSGADFREFSRNLAAILRAMPPEMRGRLIRIRNEYLATVGLFETHERMNNRTVARIFEEYRPANARPIISGEVNGVRFNLHEAPLRAADDADGEG